MSGERPIILQLCPFCGGREAGVETGNGAFYCLCSECGGRAGYRASRLEAAAQWNTRRSATHGAAWPDPERENQDAEMQKWIESLPPFVPDPLIRQIPSGTGFRYEYDGRPYIHSNRCDLCREFGAFGDTDLCPGCDGKIEQMVKNRREALSGATP